METIDLTGLSSSDDRSVARESVPREKPLPSEPRGLVDLTIPDDEEDEKTRQQATFLLETAAQAPFSRSPSSAARVPSPAKAAELNGKARTEQQTPLRLRLRHSNGTPPFRSPSNGTPRMARKEAVRSRLSGRNVHHEPLAQSEEPKPNPRSPISGQSSPLRSVTTTTGPLDSSLSRIAIQRERPELSLRNCEDIVRRHLRDMRDDHATTLRVRISLDPVEGDAHSLSKSRLESARLSLAQSRDRAVGRSQYEAGSSPFASMPAISLTGTKAPAKNPRSVGVLVVSRSKHQHQYLVTSRTMYEEPIKTIPPVSSYVSLNKNVLTKDDKLLVYYPWSGDEINSNIDAAIKDLEEKIDVRKEKFSSACTVDEKAHIWAPYAGGILSQFDCDWDAIKAYQLIPVAERKEFDKRLLHKGRVSSSSIEYFDRPQIAAAGVINRAFANVTGTSLWQTFKGHLKDDTQRLELEKAPSEGPHSLVPYAKLQCLVCGMHDCPEHGEFEEKRGVVRRIRVNYGTTLPAGRQDPATAYQRCADPREYRGLEEDGQVSGCEWSRLRKRDQGFEEIAPCSERCFWLKKNRMPPPPEWSEAERGVLDSLRAGYQDDLRGPCMLAQTGLFERSCVEIFLTLVQLTTAPSPFPSYTRNQENAEVLPPRRTAKSWKESPATDKAHAHDLRRPFTPCAHAGPCDERHGCVCAGESIVCEKSCACGPGCRRRFCGCRCAARGKPCRADEHCECWALNRECDPDLCRTCGAREALAPENRYRDDVLKGRCANVVVQRGVPKRTILGDSMLMAESKHEGLGLYMGEHCAKGDFICEYVGEILTEAETNVREVVYTHRNLSYLFTLNHAQTLDSTYMGNKSRFINGAEIKRANTYARILLCNGVQRIGMYAAKTIEPGTELCFDYGEAFMRKLVRSNEKASPQQAPTAMRGMGRTKPMKNTLSKNGMFIGRPPKRPRDLSAAEGGRLSSIASGSTGASGNTPRGTRKRRRSQVLEEELEAEEEKQKDVKQEDDSEDDADSFVAEEDEDDDEDDGGGEYKPHRKINTGDYGVDDDDAPRANERVVEDTFLEDDNDELDWDSPSEDMDDMDED